MEGHKKRLYFIDAMRAWAILMMLQGHFIDGLLDPLYREDSNLLYATWKYFRGITAPVFFTVSGFIFTFLLVRAKESGFKNPRVAKGIRRGLELIGIGYLLRLNLWGLLDGQIYPSFYLVDVLHCIGFSLLAIIGVYLLSQRSKLLFPALLLGITLVLFIFEPAYKTWAYPFLPDFMANYLTKANGSVFTIIPWLGYTTFGAFLSLVFSRFRASSYLYHTAIPASAIVGLGLIHYSSGFFAFMAQFTGLDIFRAVYGNNYLFIRLGDVLVVFAIFMLIRQFLIHRNLLRIGQNTLSIYVIHFMILYGSLTGLGLYRHLHHELHPYIVIPGALMFMVSCTYLALKYDTYEEQIKTTLGGLWVSSLQQGELFLRWGHKALRFVYSQAVRLLGVIRS